MFYFVVAFLFLFLNDSVNLFSMHHKGHLMNLDKNCDDAEHGIGIDWNGSDTLIPEDLYKCYKNESYPKIDLSEAYANESCEEILPSIHICIGEPLNYSVPVPLSGPHRPIWPAYGEYTYLPPQRWLHSLEHGAVAFLYDPCADQNEIEAFKNLAQICLRRHIISPFKNLTDGSTFNLLTYGCKLQLNKIIGQESKMIDYMRRHAIKDGPERRLSRHGNYRFGLLKESKMLTNLMDFDICPNLP